MEDKKSYYAILPANVRYDKKLTPNAKLLYAEITALSNEKGYCWAKNKYFADLYSVSTVSISKWIKNLIDCGYIKSSLIYKDGTKEILNRYLTLVNHPIKEKLTTSQRKVNDPIKEKFKDNTITINNKSNTKIEYNIFPDGFFEVWNEWLSYKKQIGKNYKTVISESSGLSKLVSLSESNSETAKKIINQSIENDWAGFFKLKNETQNKSGVYNFD